MFSKRKVKTVVIVGGGIIGTMHAWLALEAGHKVIHCERDLAPQSASIRNFGLIWVSGREAGTELALGLRARQLWEEIGSKAAIGFRANGSLTIAQNEAELGILREAVTMSDAHERGFELLNSADVKKLEPVLAGNHLGALRCSTDAAVEPSLLLNGLRANMLGNEKYSWLPYFDVVKYKRTDYGHTIKSSEGLKVSGDFIAFIPGAVHKGFLSEYFEGAPLRRVRLQMAATTPFPNKLHHSVADGDSLRYYPAFKNLSLSTLPPQSGVAADRKMQLLLVQRLDGSLTIGDTHEYIEPFDHEIREEPYEHLSHVISNLFGTPAPKILRRWDGVYSQSTNSDIYFRKEIEKGAVIVTGVGGRGNSLAPAIAEETMNKWGI